MIVDSHAHLKHGDAARTEYTPGEIVAAMDAAGIDRAVVFAMSTTTRRSIEMAAGAAEKFPERLIPYAYALPHAERSILGELEDAVLQKGFRGFKLHAGECRIADYTTGPVFEIAGGLGVPCLVDFCGDAAAAEEAAGGFPRTSLIIAHIGKYLCTDDALIDRFIEVAERHANVYLDASGVVRTWKIADAVRRVGASRVLWGTDGPHATPTEAEFARMELDKVRTCGLGAAESAEVLGGAVARLLGI